LENEKPKSKKVNKWIVFTSMPFQIGATIYLFYWIGTLLDRKFEVEGEWWMKGLTIVGVLASMYQMIRQVNYINKDE